MASKGPFQPKAFYDSMIRWLGLIRGKLTKLDSKVPFKSKFVKSIHFSKLHVKSRKPWHATWVANQQSCNCKPLHQAAESRDKVGELGMNSKKIHILGLERRRAFLLPSLVAVKVLQVNNQRE